MIKKYSIIVFLIILVSAGVFVWSRYLDLDASIIEGNIILDNGIHIQDNFINSYEIPMLNQIDTSIFSGKFNKPIIIQFGKDIVLEDSTKIFKLSLGESSNILYIHVKTKTVFTQNSSWCDPLLEVCGLRNKNLFFKIPTKEIIDIVGIIDNKKYVFYGKEGGWLEEGIKYLQ